MRKQTTTKKVTAKTAKVLKSHKYNTSPANIDQQKTACICYTKQEIKETYINSVSKRVIKALSL